MRRKIPSLGALAAFESAARHQSFTLAAQELSVTQSAVCRQISSLEEFVGQPLFRRTRRGVVLTQAGTKYSARVRTHLDAVERDTLDLMAGGAAGGSIALGVVPTFGTRWLAPRLREFCTKYPDVTVHLFATTTPFLFDESGLDAAVHTSASPWPGTEGQLLMEERLVAVAAPALLQGRRCLEATDVAQLPLLQSSTRPHAWRRWFESLGLHAQGDMAGPRMELFSMLSEAAVHGLGAALLPRFLIENELAEGRLIELLNHPFVGDRGYYLIWPQHRAIHPLLPLFRAWLDSQVTSATSGPSASK